ncbi:MAG TPA: DUF92 domain-containing protein [Gemmatimonadaceae bacterium]|nr:DUF92 domain-containing protein [Gemmatimonadaceae bacterium]
MLDRVLIGLALAGAIAIGAHRARSLSTSGAVAAVAVGALCAAAGWSWVVALVAFFVTSTALSRWRAATKAQRTGAIVAKGGDRDAVQVLANGGVFASFAALSIVVPWHGWPVLAAGSIAAATADTWATEIGSLSPGQPRSILGWHPVPAGTSGGVSALGTLASVAGAGLIGGVVWLAGWSPAAVWGALAGGVAGSLADSLLGATVQARRWCPRCGQPTERLTHDCGSATTPGGGVPWVDNDAVNALSSAVGALVAVSFLR